MLKLPAFFTEHPTPEVVAAVDLGSNSFHMIVARINDGQVRVLDRLREMVRLATGLDATQMISPEAQQRALDCLARFGQRLRDMPVDSVRIVGTNALRVAKNANDFLIKAEQAVGHPIEIIAGREEARLIYLGVAHTLSSSKEKRLVIDIGGGSTEFIIGEGFEPLRRESLRMGCVDMSEHYFEDGNIRPKNLRRAEIAALLELQPIEAMFRTTGWAEVIGSSGTLRNIERVIIEMGWGTEITAESLQKLRQALLDIGTTERLSQLKGLNPKRTAVFSGGVAILLGIFEGFGLKRMQISDGALREGLVYDLLGRIVHEDVRERTIRTLSQRYGVDLQQAERVEATTLQFLSDVAREWHLVHEEYAQMLSWAARLHEVGLSMEHENYHKHGDYILSHSDLSGFSKQELALLATLVRVHRRKFPSDIHLRCSHVEKTTLIRLGVLLRLSVLLHRSRNSNVLPTMHLHSNENMLILRFPPSWLEQHPLTQTDLEQERDYLQDVNIQLVFE
ncbi:exopolyphosphatase [Beggiatoa alba B18LD]|uniref:Exopolyphosphatase n=1 Tax=Beggiatoa alba B18LD TaxID=395493 RepID=I3CHH5_9GAMM|nr:exopolyphosphatase [Beggiatoa alba]EIJ43068.1 exopolyphosphatase [Beggiatoa alba B18LD]